MRWKLVAATAAFVVTSGCVPPPPVGLSHDFVLSYITPAPSDFESGTLFQGTVTNTGVTPADYTVALVGSSGQTGTDAVWDVLVGQTAVWSVTLTGSDVTISQAGITASPKVTGPVSAVATITRQDPQGGWYTSVYGTVTNTGSSVAKFAIELQANTGSVTTAQTDDVPPGGTAEWFTIFLGPGAARILRTTIVHSPA
jgi:hypothetical protein